METRELGRSGISVTRIVLGCGNFGGVGSAPAFFGQGIPRDEAPRIMDAAWELGITTFDTADAYGGGRSETWIGEWLATKGSDVRDAITIETKTFNPMAEGDGSRARRGTASGGRSRRASSGSASSAFRCTWRTRSDPDTPQEETLAAFDELVRAGKVGAVGASNFTAEQLAEARRDLRARRPARATSGCRTRSRSSTQGDARDRVPRLPRARARLRGVQPARRRLARRASYRRGAGVPARARA